MRISLLTCLVLACWCAPVGAQLVDQCSTDTPSVQFGDNGVGMVSSTINIADDVVITDTTMSVDLQHAFIGDVTITATSPSAIVVTLHAAGGGSNDNLQVAYSDCGVANGAPYDCGFCAMVPAGPGSMADFSASASLGDWVIDLNDTFTGSGGGFLQEWCIQLLDTACILGVSDITCTDVGGGVTDVSWINNGTYSAIEVTVNGTLEATLAGDATSYTTDPVSPLPSLTSIQVEGIGGAGSVSCDVTLQITPDCTASSSPGLPLDSTLPPAVDTLTVADSCTLGDIQFGLQITHTFVGDLEISMMSPAGTSVVLQDNNGGGVDNMDLVYWTNGIPNAAPFDCAGCLMQPNPNSLSMLDFLGEDTQGDWTITVADTVGGDTGTLDFWSVRGFIGGQDFPVSNVDCATTSGSGDVAVSWSNNGSYSAINIYVDGLLDQTLAGGDTSATVTLAVPSTATICIEAVSGGGMPLAQNCCTINVLVEPIENLTCLATAAGDAADLAWTNPTSAPYDAINVFVDGTLEATLVGTDTSYTTLPQVVPASVTVDVIGVVAGNESASVSCSVALLGIFDLTECSTPAAPISNTLPPVVDTIDVSTALQVGEALISLDITHTFVANLTADVASPAGTSVRLHNQTGFVQNINVVYGDAGIPNAEPYDCACLMQPSGPGVLADFIDENTLGGWTLTVADLAGGDDGTLNSWCVNVNEGCPIAPPSDLTCVEMPTGQATLDWTNNDTYDGGIDIVRDGTVLATVADGTTTYTDTSPTGGTNTYQVRGVDTANMCTSGSPECSLVLGLGLDQCSTTTPSPQFGDNGVDAVQDIITVDADFEIEDIWMPVQMTHAFVGDLNINVTSPAAIVVTLWDGAIGGANDNMDLIFDDSGIPYGGDIETCGCNMQPSGPGTMSDFVATTLPGDWTIDLLDTFSGSGGGTLDNWCLQVFGDGGGMPTDEINRGDCDGNGSFNGLVDGLAALNFQFVPGSPVPPCLDQCDFDDNNSFNGLVDGLGILNFQFVAGSPPPAPPGTTCGPDPTGLFDCQMVTCP